MEDAEASAVRESGAEDLVRAAHRLTRSVSKRRPRIYWTDFLATHSLGAAAFYWAAAPSTASPVRWTFFAVCVLAWYRSFAFIHEVVHFPPGQMPAFKAAWNLVAGIPLLCPSFLYSIHLEHHSRTIYGTGEDGEYIAWGIKPPVHILLFPLVSLIAPALALFRFVVLAPLSWMSRALREWVERHTSALVIRGSYLRPRPDPRLANMWRIQEYCAVLWAYLLLIGCFSGYLSQRWLFTGLAMMMTISFVNSFRTMLSHKFRNSARTMTFLQQFEDSWNYPTGGLFTELLCPVGLRYHALHHMLPHLPYHSLPRAHALLMSALPPDSLYRQTNSPGLVSSMRTLWSGASKMNNKQI